jgi:hypothetical protein
MCSYTACTTRYRGGWDATAERRKAQDELHSAAQARAWADSDFDADHGLGLDGVGAARRKEPGCAAPAGWRRRLCAMQKPLLCMSPHPPTHPQPPKKHVAAHRK